MADNQTVVQIGENSPEHVAYKLMEKVRVLERYKTADMLDLYAECLDAVKGKRAYTKQKAPTKDT